MSLIDRTFLIIGLSFFAFVPNVAHAYVDPGSAGAIVTLVLGFFAAISYTLRSYFYRIKQFFKKNDKQD